MVATGPKILLQVQVSKYQVDRSPFWKTRLGYFNLVRLGCYDVRLRCIMR